MTLFCIIYYSICLLPTLTAAPSGPPLNFAIEATTPRTLYFSWEPPPLEQQNGVIIGYVVQIISDDSGLVFQIFSNGNSTNVSAAHLMPYTVYRCTVAANTVPGTGPYSDEVLILTPEDGKHNSKHVCDFLIPHYIPPHDVSNCAIPKYTANSRKLRPLQHVYMFLIRRPWHSRSPNFSILYDARVMHWNTLI